VTVNLAVPVVVTTAVVLLVVGIASSAGCISSGYTCTNSGINSVETAVVLLLVRHRRCSSTDNAASLLLFALTLYVATACTTAHYRWP
jgi:hypothetical protein